MTHEAKCFSRFNLLWNRWVTVSLTTERKMWRNGFWWAAHTHQLDGGCVWGTQAGVNWLHVRLHHKALISIGYHFWVIAGKLVVCRLYFNLILYPDKSPFQLACHKHPVIVNMQHVNCLSWKKIFFWFIPINKARMISLARQKKESQLEIDQKNINK